MSLEFMANFTSLPFSVYNLEGGQSVRNGLAAMSAKNRNLIYGKKAMYKIKVLKSRTQ